MVSPSLVDDPPSSASNVDWCEATPIPDGGVHDLGDRSLEHSVTPRHPQHILPEEIQDHVVADWRRHVKASFSEFTFDVELAGVAVAAKGVHAGIRGVPSGLAAEHLGHV